MPRIWLDKTNFLGGEISPDLYGRTDIRIYDSAARSLQNVFISPTGGVYRRPGTKFLDILPGAGRLLSFEPRGIFYLLIFLDSSIRIYNMESLVTQLSTPWISSHLKDLQWAQFSDSLLIVHPDTPPKTLTISQEDQWVLADWNFDQSDGRVHMPHHKFAAPTVTLQAGGLTGNITITSSAPTFDVKHLGARLRIQDKEVLVGNVISPTVVKAQVIETLSSTSATTDWTEQVFSSYRGWPVSICFHQGRLVIGGSKNVPERLWFSKTGNWFNFDLGDGLDDESIAFSIFSDQYEGIRYVLSGRHLQVFTSDGEWMVSGEPLTPTSIQLLRQTKVGSRVDRAIPPIDVDGATLFVSRFGSQLREFIFSDTEQAYQARDLAILSQHMLKKPIEMAYDRASRFLHVITNEGNLATLTVYRDEGINAWTQHNTDGNFMSVCVMGEDVFFIIERGIGFTLEKFSQDKYLDCSLHLEAANPVNQFSGMENFEGQSIVSVSDDNFVRETIIYNGSMTLDSTTLTLDVGFPYSHAIEPLPISTSDLSGGITRSIRPISISFQVSEINSLSVDLGKGQTTVPLKRMRDIGEGAGYKPYSGLVTLSAGGWRYVSNEPLWRISDNSPFSFKLLSVSYQVSVAS